MPTGPSAPKFQPQVTSPKPTVRTALLENEKKAQAKVAKKRTGYQSTVLTHGLGLGDLDLKRQQAKAFKLGE
jgi:hypothetical protein